MRKKSLGKIKTPEKSALDDTLSPMKTPKSAKKAKTPKKSLGAVVEASNGKTPKSEKKLKTPKREPQDDDAPLPSSTKKRKSEGGMVSPQKKKKSFEPQPPKGKKLPKKKQIKVEEDEDDDDDEFLGDLPDDFSDPGTTDSEDRDSEEEKLFDDVPLTDSEEEREEEAKEESHAQKRKKKKDLIMKDAPRTVFVGNLPNDTTIDAVKKIFKKFGPIDSARFRGAAVADLRVPKKVAVITKQFHKDRSNISAFVVFKEEETVEAALQANGQLVGEHHIRVDRVAEYKLQKKERDQRKAIFLGNLPLDIEEDALWKVFGSCGEIESVRVIRDPLTSMGKGFGYINFKKADSVELALMKDGAKINKRNVRVQRCDKGAKSKHKNKIVTKNMKIQRRKKDRERKMKKRLNRERAAGVNENKMAAQQNSSFQGQKVIEGRVSKKEKAPKMSAKKKKVVEALTSSMKKSKKVKSE